MDIRAVVFDLFGTLIDDSPPADYGTFLHETAAALGTDPERFTALWESQDVARYTGPIEDCFESICRELSVADWNVKARECDEGGARASARAAARTARASCRCRPDARGAAPARRPARDDQ